MISMMQQFSTVFWDWNGTLIDDVSLCAQMATDTIAPRGLGPVSVEQYRKVYCHPIKAMYAALGADMSDEEFIAMTGPWLDGYERGRVNCALHAGAADILAAIQKLNKMQVVLSAHRHDLVVAALADYKLTNYFAHISGLANGGGHSKIENGHVLLKKVGTPREEVLLIGDSVHDHEVAESLGIECHLVGAGADCITKLEATGRPVFRSLLEWGAAMKIPLTQVDLATRAFGSF